MKITDYTLHRLKIPLREPIGDSQVRFDVHWMTVVELHTDAGHSGVGFQIQQGMPTASLDTLKVQFEHAVWPSLLGEPPLGLAQRIVRPRGGNVGGGYLTPPVETALWDIVAKQQELPLYRVLGGTDPRVPAYGSTLDFRLSDDEFREKLERFRSLGFAAIKIKVGHPDLAWDLRRIAITKDVMGEGVRLMVDANEAWSVKETLIRLHAYRAEGHDIFWIEDPITRDDYAGYATLCAELPFTRVNTGEYLGYSGKRRLLEHNAVDVLNVHDSIGTTRSAARLAADYGVPVSLGNTVLEFGVHLAASLPECLCLEFSDLQWNDIAVEPIRFEAGMAIAPDRLGHGIELDRDKLAYYSMP
ncbi:MAG: mandelate racemase/muconate lactonizing enzyme family protein [Planctomycetota bacterium]|nr:MAG: mandelate racemase/muconate lactonizing enzyme family protein [Planctomycetota bacterium]REJ96429.1 MAG: mandelate racemase/muconate lactonizing enzyme family protein [Planctomycetota bacterium]REK29700.1 MAG: mandelate racemase/muconate lactonizing enzyme family protein [Planctomycetota bacterium]REK30479.1 MAG: mandelate racemase/muconate lactonizing enzyme family protein [Planctomycetota bacterium]